MKTKIPPRNSYKGKHRATEKIRQLYRGERVSIKVTGTLASINTIAHRILGRGGYAIRRTIGGYMVYINNERAKK